MSASWGESETFLQAAILSGQEASAYDAAFDEAFLELAVQGQSAFDASGDAGAYDASSDLGTTNLSVDTNSDSPYITATGGTTLPWTGTLTGPDGTRHRDGAEPARLGLGLPVAGDREDHRRHASSRPRKRTSAAAAAVSASSSRPRSTRRACRARTAFHAVQYLTPTDYQTIVARRWSSRPPGTSTPRPA